MTNQSKPDRQDGEGLPPPYVAPPKPAPNAVREALDGFVNVKNHTWDDLYGLLNPNSGFGRKWIERFEKLRAASVPPADGADNER